MQERNRAFLIAASLYPHVLENPGRSLDRIGLVRSKSEPEVVWVLVRRNHQLGVDIKLFLII